MDGLLINTEHYYTEVLQQIAERYGKNFDWSLKPRILGLRSHESAEIIVETLELPIAPQKYLDLRNEILPEMFSQCQPMPGVERLTRHLAKFGIPQAVATSTNKEMLEAKFARHGEWFSLFESIITSDEPEVTEGKPAPDIFVLAARRLGHSAENCLAFEDAPSGTRAAHAAGMSLFAIPEPNMDRCHYPDASEILNSMENFQPETWGLPSYKEPFGRGGPA